VAVLPGLLAGQRLSRDLTIGIWLAGAGLAGLAVVSGLAGQVARIQAPSWRVRPRPARFRRFRAAVRRLSQA
jgi:hypothetical protein